MLIVGFGFFDYFVSWFVLLFGLCGLICFALGFGVIAYLICLYVWCGCWVVGLIIGIVVLFVFLCLFSCCVDFLYLLRCLLWFVWACLFFIGLCLVFFVCLFVFGDLWLLCLLIWLSIPALTIVGFWLFCRLFFCGFDVGLLTVDLVACAFVFWVYLICCFVVCLLLV